MAGYAQLYLKRCNKESDSNQIIDIELYEKLVELDEKLGLTASEQLFICFWYTTRWDIIKVRFYDLNISFEFILGYQF